MQYYNKCITSYKCLKTIKITSKNYRGIFITRNKLFSFKFSCFATKQKQKTTTLFYYNPLLIHCMQQQFLTISPVVHNTQWHSHPVVIWEQPIQPNNRVYITEVFFAEYTACHGRAILRVSWTHKNNSRNYLLI